jgi:hypothetical protein
MSRYRATFRVNDVVFTDTFATQEEAFKQAKAWAEAGLTDVSLTDGEREYPFEDFVRKVPAVGERNDTP